MKTTINMAGVLVAAAVLAFPMSSAAQSVDALLDKLVDKGMLTVNEANELRQETDKDFTKAHSVKTGLPEWVNSVKFNGDVRMRYEGFFADNPAAVDRNRYQYRLRAGFTVQMLDQVEAGFRLASEGDTRGNPISSNQTFDNNATKKGVALDLVYGKWTAVNNSDWSLALTAGKMEMPLVISPAYIDRDYTPEGFAQQFKWHVAPLHTLSANLGEFVLEEDGGGDLDSWMLAGQLRLNSTWSEHLTSSVGLIALMITQTESLRPSRGQLDIGEGNTRVGGFATNAPVHDFHPIIADAEITYTLESFPLYPVAFPITVGGSYLHNPGASTDNTGYNLYVAFGKAGKRRMWELAYEYRFLEADAIYEELPESDFNAFAQSPRMIGGRSGFQNGTNIRGHVIRAGYSPFDSITLNITYWITQNILETPAGSDSDASRLQVDAIWKF